MNYTALGAQDATLMEPRSALRLVTDALEQAGCDGRGSSWNCPVKEAHQHGDRHKSLSVTWSGGKVLLNCHTGCSAEDVVAALGLQWPALFDDGQPVRPEPAQYTYTDADGTVIGRKTRTVDKKFSWQHPDGGGGWVFGLNGTKPGLYRLPQLIDAIKAGKHVFIVEGERDVETLTGAGHVATCSPDGASKKLDRPKWYGYGPVFKDADVTIIADNDDAGFAHAKATYADVVKYARSVKVKRTPIEQHGADVTDHLNARLGMDDLMPVLLIPEQPDSGVLAGIRSGGWLDRQTFPDLEFAIPGLIPEGLTLLIGPPKAGKSWLVLAFCLAVAAGGVALSKIRLPAARRVLYLALEDGDRRMQSRCRTLLGDTPIPDLFHYVTQVKPGQLIELIGAWIKEYPDTGMVVIDTLGKVMPPSNPGESSYQRDYRVMSEIKNISDSNPGLAIIVTHHDRKATSEDFVDSVSGTNGLAGAVDTVSVLCRRRQSREAIFKVTGKDVPENEYALTLDSSQSWQLDGADLDAAAEAAGSRQERDSLGDVANQILKIIRERPEGIRPAGIAELLPDDVQVNVYLGRLLKQGRIDKVGRGLYVAL